HQRRRRCRRHLSKAEFRRGCLSRRRFHPKEPVRLHIETGGSMTGCIEDLFTQCLWNLDRLKGLNRSPAEEHFQDFAHKFLLCCYYNISMLQTQHTKTQCRRCDWVHTQYGLSFVASGKQHTCRTSEKKSINAIDYVVGSEVKYQVD